MAWLDIILSFITAQICFVTIVFMMFRKPKNGLVKAYIALHTLYCCWAFCTLILLIFDLDTKADIFVNLKYLSAFSIGPIWFIFYLYFSRSSLIKHTLNFTKVLAIFSPVLLLQIIYYKKGFFHLVGFFDDRGKIIYSNGLWVCMIVQSIYHFAALIIVMRNAFTKQTKELSILITAGFTLSQCITVLYYGSRLYYDFNFMDIFPCASLITLATFGIALHRYQFMNILPMALSEIVNSLHEGIMIVDGKGKIASSNRTLEMILGKSKSQLMESNASDISDFILENWKYSEQSINAILAIGKGSDETVKGEIEYDNEIQYEVHCQPLKNANLLNGWVVSFYNIHEHKSLADELSRKNRELSEAYTKLIEHAKVVDELAASRERNKIASEIHDSVGHCLAILVSILNVAKLTYAKQPDFVEEKINTAYTIAKNGLSELRFMVSNFSTKECRSNNLLEALQAMVEEFKSTGVKVDLTVQGTPPHETGEKLWAAIYNTCLESLTNALKHGEAQNVIIILRFNDKNIELYIFDDGKGCNKIVKNIGLQGMENRVHELNGRISFGSGGERGFNTYINIPRQ